jgi:hypothetical protein
MPRTDDPKINQSSWYSRTFARDWDLPPIRGPPSFALYRFENGKILLEDAKFGGPLDNGFVPTVQNSNVWINYNVAKYDASFKKTYKYNNEGKLREVNR